MDHHSPASYSEPPPPSIDAVYHHHHDHDHHHDHHNHHQHPQPDDPPPSYDDATNSATAPLLVGRPPDYGAFRAYSGPDDESDTSSEAEVTERSLSEWIGQALVVFLFMTIFYAFVRIITAPPDRPTHWP